MTPRDSTIRSSLLFQVSFLVCLALVSCVAFSNYPPD